jgi:hypothetical protein
VLGQIPSKKLAAKKLSFQKKTPQKTKHKRTNGRGESAGLGKKENKVVRQIKRKSEADEVRGE